MTLKIALIGATGNVGRKTALMLLERRLVDPKNLTLFASEKSVGKIVSILNYDFSIGSMDTIDFNQYNLCLFNTESEVSEQYIPRALDQGCYVVDSSSKYRLEDNIPLVVPPVNKDIIRLSTSKLYSHANCVTSPIATVIAPLHSNYKITRVNAVTYQSTSGAGKIASDDCWNEIYALTTNNPYKRQYFERQIAFNVIPQVGQTMEDGNTFEEFKIMNEVKKVVDKNIAITVTSVRVPVMIGHSVALNIEFADKFELNQIENILNSAPAILYQERNYCTPVEVVNSDSVYVGRIRRDPSIPNGINLWLCSDNLRRGAATDSVEIAEEIVNEKINGRGDKNGFRK